MERHECYETFYELYKYVCISLEAIVDHESHPHVYFSLSFTWGQGDLNQGARSSGKFEDIRIHFHLFDHKD